MVSKAKDDFPEPEIPVMTTSFSRGISRSIFLRLWTRAPRIIRLSNGEEMLFSGSWRVAEKGKRASFGFFELFGASFVLF